MKRIAYMTVRRQGVAGGRRPLPDVFHTALFFFGLTTGLAPSSSAPDQGPGRPCQKATVRKPVSVTITWAMAERFGPGYDRNQDGRPDLPNSHGYVNPGRYEVQLAACVDASAVDATDISCAWTIDGSNGAIGLRATGLRPVVRLPQGTYSVTVTILLAGEAEMPSSAGGRKSLSTSPDPMRRASKKGEIGSILGRIRHRTTGGDHRTACRLQPADLPDGFEYGDRHGIGQVQAAGLGADRDSERVVRTLAQPVRGKTAGLGAEDEGIAHPVSRVCIDTGGSGAERPEPVAAQGRGNVAQAVDDPPIQVLPVIQASPA
jgi:hypothetical protein